MPKGTTNLTSGKMVEVQLDEMLYDSPKKATSMSLPVAVHHRLDLMATAARLVNPSRAEIIGMLITEAEVDPESLERRLLKYRKLVVAEALPHHDLSEPGSSDNVTELPMRGAGRPPKR